ncbi:MAG TPA: DUF932 domain-containing protein [Cyclobacteriaceae bacterium]|jgi:phage/plasmid-like protein (TIGR03299 family)|nr:DUF932 domain-containing protein [Cyclobacteriaceae bacterium]
MHNINLNSQTGKFSFVSARERAWHKLGQLVSGAMTSEECIREAQLDYEVIKVPNFALVNGEYKPTEAYSTVRKDTGDILGDKLGVGYTIVQNLDAFKFFDKIVADGEAIFETAGALGKGETIFITAKLPGYIHVGGDDIAEKYLLLANGHGGNLSVIAGFTAVRVVCNNTLKLALRSMKNIVRIRHTYSAQSNLDIAANILGIANQYTKDMEDIFKQMAKKQIVEKDLKMIVQKSIGTMLQQEKLAKDEELSKNFIKATDLVMEYAWTAPSQLLPTTYGSLWGAYNAVTGYFQNVAEYADASTQFRSIMLGGKAEQAGQKAFDLCLSML